MNAAIEAAGIILAAGDSTRMGRPKALLDWNGETFLGAWVRAFRDAGVRPVVVLGRDAGLIAQSEAAAGEALLLMNPAPERGQFSSLRIALEALPESVELVFFTPVDAAGVRAGTVRQLVDAWRRERPVLVAPCHAGRHGHPVGFGRDVVREFLAEPADGMARNVTRRHRGHTLFVDVDDPGVVRDLDTPEAYAAARQAEEA